MTPLCAGVILCIGEREAKHKKREVTKMKHQHKDDSGTFDCPLGSECPPISASEAECRIMAWIEYHEFKGRTLQDAEAKEHQHRAKNYRIVLEPLQAEMSRLKRGRNFLLEAAKDAERELTTKTEPIASCELLTLRKAITFAEGK